LFEIELGLLAGQKRSQAGEGRTVSLPYPPQNTGENAIQLIGGRGGRDPRLDGQAPDELIFLYG
jgi:hypothetical protein